MEFGSQNGRKCIFLVILSLTVHLLLLLCTLDIYFSTPLVHTSNHFKVKGVKPPANRIVFILADGLSAAAFYTKNFSTVTPFLHSIKENESSWGLSHVQPPTESRPQHTALLAGFNEDPSSIFSRWKYNLYDFDTVLRLANMTFYFGSAACFRYFHKRESLRTYKKKLINNYLTLLLEYYSNMIYVGFDRKIDHSVHPRIPIYVERAVFNKARNFIRKGLVPRSAKGQIIFVYVEGTDLLAHSFSHHSRYFRKNLMVLDEEVQELVKTIKSYFNDDKTAFIFTSDHGITVDEYSKRSHGGGSKGEIEVPFLAWGAGISVDKTEPKNLKSIDIPPLISALIGIAFPRNSLGSIPLNVLNISSRVAGHMLIANALQLTDVFYAKQDKLINNPAVLFVAENKFLMQNKIDEWKRAMIDLFYTTRFTKSIDVALEYIDNVMNAIRYYDSYSYWYRTVFVMVAAVGWLINLLTWLPMSDNVYSDQTSKKKRNTVTAYVMVNMFLFLLYHVFGSKYDYILYIFFPSFTWFLVYIRRASLKRLCKGIFKCKVKDTIAMAVFFGFGTEMLILTFFNRKYLIPVVIGIICSSYNRARKKTALAHVWIILGLFICVILYLPPADPDYNLYYQLLYFSLFCIAIIYLDKRTKNGAVTSSWFDFLMKYRKNFLLVLVLTLLNNFTTDIAFQWKWYDVITAGQFISWFSLLYAIIFILRSPKTICYRLSSLVYAPMPIYVLLNGSMPPIAMLLFIGFVIIWTISELVVSEQSEVMWNIPYDDNNVTVNMVSHRENARKIFIFMSLCALVFFETLDMNTYRTLSYSEGDNSINNFLIAVKIVLPFIILTSSFLVLVKASKIEIGFVFTLLLLFSTVMMMQVFFTVKTQGSWKEITISLVRFIIATIIPFGVLVTYYVSYILAKTEMHNTVRFIRQHVNLFFDFYEIL
ncbi:GPI ethanolamine phosphate transferase 1-like isoform X2 [Agrilus planipennis]|uniref:GPI ethanolamine phosphate transferase 1 n=1 Tax=Agrilus planipennis TaxID=224129 RepID=A0A1W4X6M4_AGRPL|nr:GPI ethanolamine phosphate transferase 1-like isoform X2 [Agrilus planipennis]